MIRRERAVVRFSTRIRPTPGPGLASRLVGGACLVALSWHGTAAFAAQRCDVQRYPASTVATRFHDQSDGTIVDSRSKLMWMRCSAGQTWSGARCDGEAGAFTFSSAQAVVDDINRRGSLFFSDWRLPRVPELAAIAERECANPRIDLALFPDTPAEFYWTATTRPAPSDGYAFALSFGAEGIRYLDKAQAVHLRLVRDAR